MSYIFLQIFELLSVTNLSLEPIWWTIALLDDYTINPVHDFIFDNLVEYLDTGDKQYLLAARGMCIQQIFQNN